MFYTELFTSNPPDHMPHFLGDTFNITTIIMTLILGAIAICLNTGVAIYHRDRKRNVAFVYFILSFSDLCTGICALLHTLTFTVMQLMPGNMTSHVLWLVVPAYFFTMVTFKVSAFVSMLIAIIRAINMFNPAREVNQRAATIAVGIYALFWVLMFVVDVSVVIDSHSKYFSEYLTESLQGILGYFFFPNKCKWAEYLVRKYHYAKADFNLECLVDAVYTIPPFFLCAGIALAATVVQVTLLISQKSPTVSSQNNKRDISITIALITILFSICMSLTLYQPLHFCAWPSALKDRRMFYIMGYFPFFVNAAINPVILVCRDRNLRVFLCNKLRNTEPYVLVSTQNDCEKTVTSFAI